MANVDPEVVCPTAEELTVENPVTCSVEGCGQAFRSSTCLHMHVMRHHQAKQLSTEGGRKQERVFYCPVEGCGRSKRKGRPFPRLGQLKQHFQTMHGNKGFVCRTCGKKFGLRDVWQRHEGKCGQLFKCTSCHCEFHSRNALYQHAKRKKHALPVGSNPRANKKQSSSHPSTIILAPVIIKPVIQVIAPQQKQMQDAGVQTEIPLLPPLHHHTTSTSSSQTVAESYLDLGTQTDFSDIAMQLLS